MEGQRGKKGQSENYGYGSSVPQRSSRRINETIIRAQDRTGQARGTDSKTAAHSNAVDLRIVQREEEEERRSLDECV